jgi:hypothetical protein
MPTSTSGLHGPVHIRAAEDQIFDQSLHVRCPKEMVDLSRYEVGTKFRLRVKLTDKEGSRSFLHAPHQWKFEVILD